MGIGMPLGGDPGAGPGCTGGEYVHRLAWECMLH